MSLGPVRRIELCGVRCDVRTDHGEFARYLAAHFPHGQHAPQGAADLSVDVRWCESAPSALTPEALFPGWPVETRIDRHVYLGPRHLLWLRVDDAPQIAIACAREGRTRRFEVRYHFTLGARGWREKAKRALAGSRIQRLRHARFSTLVYYAVYYPVWWHLEAAAAAHPLHAAAVAFGDRALVLAGLPGGGKSSLALGLLGTNGGELLSDNVILHSGTQVQGCFEPLLLDARTRALVTGAGQLAPLGRRHMWDREAFHVTHRVGAVVPARILLLGRGHETRLEPLDPRLCARLLLAVNEAAKEVRRYHVLAAILGMAETDALAGVAERAAQLERLCATVPCHRLVVREGAPSEALALLTEPTPAAREAVR